VRKANIAKQQGIIFFEIPLQVWDKVSDTTRITQKRNVLLKHC